MSLLSLFASMLKASLLSTGGMGNAPIVHSDFVAGHLATERQFSSALAIGQLSPGPTGLWVVAFGYMLGGWLGGLATLLAICIPPFSILGVRVLYERANEHPAVEGFVWGLGVTVAGVSAAVMLKLPFSEGTNFGTVAIAVVALAVGLHGKIPVVWVILAGALAGWFLR